MNRLSNKFKLKKRKGSALLFVVIAFLIVFILLSSVFILSQSNTRQVAAQEQGIHSEYIARSGAEAMFEFLINDATRLSNYDTWEDPYITNLTIDFSEGEAVVTVEKTTQDGRKRVKITSIGEADGTDMSRKAVLEFDLDGYTNIRWSR
jgi:type II secretory pathway component PulK